MFKKQSLRDNAIIVIMVLHKTEEVEENQGKWCLKFPGADRTVMLRTERYRYDVEKKRPAQVQAYIQVFNWLC